MKKNNPRVFIGSSREALKYVYAVQKALNYVAEVTPWSAGVFQPLRYPMEDLEAQLDRSDFAVFICSPDDFVNIRGKNYVMTRDNTLFEMGLFWGKLKRGRVFFLIPHSSVTDDISDPNSTNYHLLSDFTGLNPLTYDFERENTDAAVSIACSEISKVITEYGAFEDPKKLLELVRIRQAERDAIAMFILKITKELISSNNSNLYHVLTDALRSVYAIYPDFSINGVGAWKKTNSEGLKHVSGKKGQVDFYPFNINQGKDDNHKDRILVIDCFNKSEELILKTEDHFVKTYLICYPIQNDLVLTVTINGSRELSEEEIKLLIPMNSELMKTVNDLLGGASQ
ncbi:MULTISPECIES: nucleotide-binding protein [Bacillus]|uniref:nucleotide-binding protein n=1 Tax=Bacillus TaxID=1386 RepID=UPI0002D9029F|nr:MULTISPECIES: nucleotide-binding protein [Bacillus]